MSKRKGMELVDGWIRYAIDSRPTSARPVSLAGPGYAMDASALAYAQLPDGAKAVAAAGGAGTMVFSARDLAARHAVEGELSRLRGLGFPIATLLKLLIEVHFKGSDLEKVQLADHPGFGNACRSLGIERVEFFQFALRRFYVRLGESWYSAHPDETIWDDGTMEGQVAAFLGLKTRVSVGARLGATELYKAFLLSIGRTLSEGCWTQAKFGRLLREAGYAAAKSNGRMVYEGLDLLPARDTDTHKDKIAGMVGDSSQESAGVGEAKGGGQT